MAVLRRKLEWVLLGQAGYAAATVRAQVERICDSAAFARNPSLLPIFRYLVEEALAGRMPQPADVSDGLRKLKTIISKDNVRTYTGRLRLQLRTYYAKGLKRGEIRLEIPEKTYLVIAPRHRENAPGVSIPINTSILEPPEKEEVRSVVSVRGRIESMDPDLRPWLVVLASDSFYYPQCRVSRRSPSWEYEVRIGRMEWGETDGVEFKILLVAADVDGDFAFQQYKNENRDGYGTRLPSDVRVLNSRTVIRRDNVPGGPTTDRLPPKGVV